MYRRRFLAAKARYRCEWKCSRCGRMNHERGEVSAADQIAVNHFTSSLYDEVNLSGEIAQEKACRKLYRLQQAVNGQHWLWGLQISGMCRKCGRQQSWAPMLRHTWAMMMAAAGSAAVVWRFGLPDSWISLLNCLAAAGTAALITEGIALSITRWRLRRLADLEYAPYMEELFPED